MRLPLAFSQMTCTASELLLMKEKVTANPAVESMTPSAEQAYWLAPEKLNAGGDATVGLGLRLGLAAGAGVVAAEPGVGSALC